MSVRLFNAVVDIFKIGDAETIIIRGIVDPESLSLIKVAAYQREILPGAKVKSLVNALKTSTVPDIELGMRGDKYQVREAALPAEKGRDTYFLQDDVYVIDGLQRISAAQVLLKSDPEARPRIGAVVHLSTTEDWETERFRILNQERTKLNVNVLLRNLHAKSQAMDMLLRLCLDEMFPLCNRVQWSQRMGRAEIIPAMVLCQTTGYLHCRFGPGKSTKPDEIAASLDKTMERVGRTTMRENVKTFFQLIDECFGIRRMVYNHGAVYMRKNFLITLAEILGRHENFWNGQRLHVEKDLRLKINKFPIDDPEISRLASSQGPAADLLYMLLLKHINSGKRTRRLKPVEGMEPKDLEYDLPAETKESTLTVASQQEEVMCK